MYLLAGEDPSKITWSFVLYERGAGRNFLRIARSSLAESKTSIEELYDWEFDGPFLRDFAGKEPTGKGRDAGAFEADTK